MTSEFEPLKIALIGCGGMGERHAKAIAEMHALHCRPVEVVAVCDFDEGRRAKISALLERGCGHRPREYSDVSVVLDQPDIDAVDIVLPTSLHHTVILAALDAGKHALVEKPLALTVLACNLIVEAATRTKKVVAVSENYRRIWNNRAMGALFQSGSLGELNAMFVRNFASPEPPVKASHPPIDSPRWYRDRMHVGGYHAMEMGVHEADLQSYWFGPIETVTAEMEKFGDRAKLDPNASEDMLTASLRFPSGMVTHLAFCSVMRGFEVADRLLIGRKAVVTSNSWHAWQNGIIKLEDGRTQTTEKAVSEWLVSLSDTQRRDLLPTGAWLKSDQGSIATEPLSYGVGLAIYDFARAVRMDRKPEITAELARRAVATCCAIWESAFLRAPVQVDQVLTGELREAQSPMNEAIGLAA